MVKYEDVKVGDYVMLNASAVSYNDTNPDKEGIIEGYEKYLERPCLITDKRDKNGDISDFTVDDNYGIFTEHIKEILTKEDYPEYYI